MIIPPFFNIGVACTDAHLGTPTAGRIAMIVEDAERGTSQVTFAELAELTSRFAQALRDLGVDAGERVLIRLPNCLAYPIAFLGAMKRGAIPVPSSIMLTAEEVGYLLDDAGASVLVTDRRSWGLLGGQTLNAGGLKHVILVELGSHERAPSEPSLPSQTGPTRSEPNPSLAMHALDALLAAVDSCDPPHPTRADDPAYLVYTSGTTAFPKGVLHAHRALLGRRPAMEAWFDFHGDDRVLHSGKFNWTYVLGTAMMDPLYLGQTAIVYEGKADATRWMPLVAKHRATIFIGVPTIYRQILQKTDFSAADVPTLRHCMCAGEHLSDDVLVGYRVSPFEVERVLKDHPAVADCAVIGEEVGSDKTIIAVYVLLAPGKIASAEEIIAFAGQHLASYKCPRAVHFVPDLPRTANGKVLRRALRR